jgi:hypothetical protein
MLYILRVFCMRWFRLKPPIPLGSLQQSGKVVPACCCRTARTALCTFWAALRQLQPPSRAVHAGLFKGEWFSVNCTCCCTGHFPTVLQPAASLTVTTLSGWGAWAHMLKS